MDSSSSSESDADGIEYAMLQYRIRDYNDASRNLDHDVELLN